MAQCHVCREFIPIPGPPHVCSGRPIPSIYAAPIAPMAPPMAPPMGIVAPPVNPGLNRRLSYYDRARKLTNEAAAHAIPAPTKAKFDRGLETWLTHKVNGPSTWVTRSSALTVSDFIALPDADRLRLVDIMWEEILILKSCLKRRDQMVDPAPGAFQGLVLPHGFSGSGYCFRCDTRTVAHVTTYGFKTAYSLAAPADIQDTLPHRVAAGLLGTPKQVGMWKDNRDAVNEMSVCVSRNMKGCTKFPNPETTGAATIFALKIPPDKLGFDTEAWQATEVGGLWRPGEKAFLDLAPSCVIASVGIVKELATGADELHRFRVTTDRWTWAPGATYADHAALGPELVALYNGGLSQAVLRADDFVMGQ
jgi:hypothetical protein